MAIENNPFGVEKIEDAKDLIARPDADKVQANFSFYYGDHWQGGDAWSGPIPATSDEDYNTVSAEIERGLGSKNVVKEITDRAGNAVTGRTPIWDVVPNRVVDESNPITEEEKTQIAEAKVLLQNWIEQKEFDKYLSKSLRQTLLSGKSTLRVFIPTGYVLDGSAVVDTEKPLDILEMDAPHPLESGVVQDPNSREKMGVHIGDIGTAEKPVETAELSYLLPVATVNGRVTEITLMVDKEGEQSVQLDLGGRLPIYQMEMPRLVTEQIVAMQKALNLNLTMMQRNSVLGGFLERVILNGQLPGHYDEDGVFVRDEYITGAGSVSEINGIPTVDPTTGEIKDYTTASIQYKDPVSPSTFIQAAEFLYRSMLESSDQLHALISGDAAASGESRRQAVASFFSYLKTPKQEVDKAGKWMLETGLAYAGYLTGTPGKYKGLKVTFETKLDTGATPIGEVDLLERLATAGILSLRTVRERLAVGDTEDEQRQIDEEKGQLAANSNKTSNNTSVITGQPLQNTDNRDITGE